MFTPGERVTWRHGKACKLGNRPVVATVEKLEPKAVIVRTADGRTWRTSDFLLEKLPEGSEERPQCPTSSP